LNHALSNNFEGDALQEPAQIYTWIGTTGSAGNPMVLSFEKALPVVHQLVEQGPGLSAVPVEGGPPLPESLKSVVNTNGSDSCRHATTTNDHRASRL
jgi:hypothetical protein